MKPASVYTCQQMFFSFSNPSKFRYLIIVTEQIDDVLFSSYFFFKLMNKSYTSILTLELMPYLLPLVFTIQNLA